MPLAKKLLHNSKPGYRFYIKTKNLYYSLTETMYFKQIFSIPAALKLNLVQKPRCAPHGQFQSKDNEQILNANCTSF